MAYNCHFSTVSPLFGYVTPTKGFVYALVVMFAFNIWAGMRADGVAIVRCKIEGSIGEMKELMKKQQEMMENFIKKFES